MVDYVQGDRPTACWLLTGRPQWSISVILGEEVSVCVTVTVHIPLLPEFIDANTGPGGFVVERDLCAHG